MQRVYFTNLNLIATGYPNVCGVEHLFAIVDNVIMTGERQASHVNFFKWDKSTIMKSVNIAYIKTYALNIITLLRFCRQLIVPVLSLE